MKDFRLIPNKYSFRLTSKKPIEKFNQEDETQIDELAKSVEDFNKRDFLKILGIAGLGLAATTVLPKKADALVVGSTPASNVVGIKNSSNVKINPATEETLQSIVRGQGVQKGTTSLSSSGAIKIPSSGKKLRIYATRFSLSADATLVSFRFTSGGTDFEKYLSPKTGGLYGSNNHPNYVEGGIDESFYCSITGTTTIQVNYDYLEI